MDSESQELLDLAKMLVRRLERLSADSFWAHRASGARGSLLKIIDQIEHSGPGQKAELDHMEEVVRFGFKLLEKAAREYR